MGNDSLTNCFTKSFLSRKKERAITFLRDGRPETEISYFELESDSNRMANVFLDSGVQKGDRVVLFLPKSVIAAVAHFAQNAITVPSTE